MQTHACAADNLLECGQRLAGSRACQTIAQGEQRAGQRTQHISKGDEWSWLTATPRRRVGIRRYCVGNASSSLLYVSLCGTPNRMMYTIESEAVMKMTFITCRNAEKARRKREEE